MISVLYTIILITNFKLIEMCIKSSLLGRVGVGLLELLKRLRPEPGVAEDVVHADVSTVEAQAVRVVIVPWAST